jgi:hypothetical protein
MTNLSKEKRTSSSHFRSHVHPTPLSSPHLEPTNPTSVYITLLTTTIIFLILLTMEAVAYIQSTMTDFFPRFHKLGAWKMRIVLVEFLTLAVLLHNVEELGVVASVLMLTGLSRCVSFCFWLL